MERRFREETRQGFERGDAHSWIVLSWMVGNTIEVGCTEKILGPSLSATNRKRESRRKVFPRTKRGRMWENSLA